jgi:hypothetical protein
VEEQIFLLCGQEAERGRGRSLGQDVPKNMSLMLYFLQLGPTSRSFYHLAIMPSNYESVYGLIH